MVTDLFGLGLALLEDGLGAVEGVVRVLEGKLVVLVLMV